MRIVVPPNTRSTDHLGSYADAFGAVPVALALLQTTTPRASFIEVNAAFGRLFGFEPEDMVGMTMYDLTLPADLPRSDDQVQRLLAGRLPVLELEKRLVRRDGSVFWGVSRAKLLPESSPRTAPLVVVDVCDVSARKAAELEAAARARQQESSERHGEVGSFEFDPRTGTRVFSERMSALLGLRPGAAPPLQSEALEAVHPEDRPAVRAAIASWRRPQRLEFRYLRPDGRLSVFELLAGPLLDDTGRPDRAAGTIRDVTALRAQEDVLAATEPIVAAFERSPLPQLVIGASDGATRIVQANAAAAALLGRTADELAGVALADVLVGTALPPVLARAMTTRDEGATAELVLRTDQGVRPAWVEVLALGREDDTAPTALMLIHSGRGDPRTVARARSALSEREIEVLQCAAEGRSVSDIGRALQVSPQTVKSHLRSVYLKLGVGDRAAAVAAGFRARLLR